MKRFLAYLRESRVELGKVDWPTRRQAARLTIIVVIFSIIFAAFIAGIDFVFSELLQKVVLKG